MKLIIHLHGSDKLKAHATLSRNWYQKTCTGFLQVSCNSIPIFFWYQNLVRVRALLYSMSIKETGTSFLVLVFGTSFWIICLMLLGLLHIGPSTVADPTWWLRLWVSSGNSLRLGILFVSKSPS